MNRGAPGRRKPKEDSSVSCAPSAAEETQLGRAGAPSLLQPGPCPALVTCGWAGRSKGIVFLPCSSADVRRRARSSRPVRPLPYEPQPSSALLHSSILGIGAPYFIAGGLGLGGGEVCVVTERDGN